MVCTVNVRVEIQCCTCTVILGIKKNSIGITFCSSRKAAHDAHRKDCLPHKAHCYVSCPKFHKSRLFFVAVRVEIQGTFVFLDPVAMLLLYYVDYDALHSAL